MSSHRTEGTSASPPPDSPVSASSPPDSRPRPAVLAVVVAVAVVGATLMVHTFHRTVIVFPAQALLSVGFCVVLIAVGWWVLRRLNPLVPADRCGAAACLAWGMLPATGFAVVANHGLTDLWSRLLSLETGSDWKDALSAPVNEELLKLAGVLLLALALAPSVRGPLDGFVWGAFVGLGFQVSENFVYGVQSVELVGGTGTGSTVLGTLVPRFATALSSHWAMSALAGAGLGFLLARRGQRGAVAGGVGLILLAMGLHLLFDSPLVGGAAGLVLRATLNFLVAMGVYLMLRRRFRRAAAAQLRSRGGDPQRLRRRTRHRELRRQPDRRARRTARSAQRRLLAETADHAHRTA